MEIKSIGDYDVTSRLLLVTSHDRTLVKGGWEVLEVARGRKGKEDGVITIPWMSQLFA